MAKLTKTKIGDENGSYYQYKVVDNEGSVLYQGDSETKARNTYKDAKREEVEQAAEAADGNAAASSSSSSSSKSSSSDASAPDDSPGTSTSAPAYESTDDTVDAPDPKIAPLEAGEPTNTMATGNPKEYKSTDAKEDSSKPKESQKLNVKGAMSVVGAGVAVAALATNAGGIKNAAEDIAVAAAGAIASKAGEIIGEYSSKFVSLPLSIPTRIAKYTGERIAKSKGDKDENGVEYDPVKLSIGDVMSKFTDSNEDQIKKQEDETDEKNKNNAADKAKQKAQKYIESANKLIEKSNDAIGKIMEHAAEGVDWVQTNLNKEAERAEKNIRDGLDKGYQSVEKDIDKFSKGEGEKIAVKLIKEYNKLIEEQAKNIVDEKNKAKSKATIKGKAAIQKAKLKLFALIGL